MRSSSACIVSVALSAVALAAAYGAPGSPSGSTRARAVADTGLERVLRGRLLTINHACAGCHGGGANPAAEGYLAGMMAPEQEFLIGPCALQPGAGRSGGR